MIENKIYYRRVRTFGEVFGATFNYIKQNFKSFFGSIILFSLPVIALIAFLLVNIVSRATSGMGSFNSWSNSSVVVLMIMVITVLAIIMQTVFVTVINQHLILSENLGPETKVTTGDVGSSFFSSFWRVLGNTFLLGIIGIVFFIIYALFNAFLTMAFSATGMGGALFAAMIQLLTSLMISPVIAFYGVSCLFVVQKDKVNAFTALGKVSRYLKGNFWQTWSVSFVGYLMAYISSAIVAIPIIIFMMVGLFSRFKYNYDSPAIGMSTIIIGAIVFVITVLLFLCVYSLYLLICTFQYTSLEEKNEGVNILDKINQIQ